jgi:hypothetical protein
MKTTIRRDTFETNSSSEHSLSIDNSIVNLLNEIIDSINYNADDYNEMYAVLGKLDIVKDLIKKHIKENF